MFWNISEDTSSNISCSLRPAVVADQLNIQKMFKKQGEYSFPNEMYFESSLFQKDYPYFGGNRIQAHLSTAAVYIYIFFFSFIVQSSRNSHITCELDLWNKFCCNFFIFFSSCFFAFFSEKKEKNFSLPKKY